MNLYFKSKSEAEDFFYKESALNYEYISWGFNTEFLCYEVLFQPPLLSENHRIIKVMGVI